MNLRSTQLSGKGECKFLVCRSWYSPHTLCPRMAFLCACCGQTLFLRRFAANSATGEFDPRSHTDFDSTAPCEVVREAETGSNWRPRNKPFLDIRHDRCVSTFPKSVSIRRCFEDGSLTCDVLCTVSHDLVPPPAEWNFPDWRHEQQQQLVRTNMD